MADDIKVVGLASNKVKGKTNWKIMGAIVGIIVLSVGVIAGIFLVRQQQDIREQAGGNCENPASIVQCPRSDGALVSCNPPDQNGNAQISLCDRVGRTEVCGGVNYCCPSVGGAWTTNMTACAACDAKAPTGGTTESLTETSTIIKWTGGTGGKLRLWVSTDPNPTSTCSATSTSCVVNDKELTIDTTQYELTGLKPNTKYYWRIMAWTREGCDSGGATYNFTTTGSGGASATPTATSTSTSKATVTATSKATSTSTTVSKTATPTTKATSTGSGTPFPVPETGADLPTVLGLSFGVVMILVSLGLAL